MAGYIARELVRKKTLSQIDMLREMPSHPVVPGQIIIVDGLKVTIKKHGESVYGRYIWEAHEEGLEELSRMNDIDLIRLLEARLANKYWSYFVGLPITWDAVSEKKVPPHWKSVTDRLQTFSEGSTPRHAINPYHAALNYLYGVAEHLLLRAIHPAGLDPACGFLHYDKEDRLSLVYDLIEPHRAEIDRLVWNFFARTKLHIGDVNLLPEGHIMLNPGLLRYLIVSCMPDGKRFADTVTWLVDTLSSR